MASIEAAVAPKMAHEARPAKRVIGEDLVGTFEGEFGGGISPAGRPRLPIRLMVSLLYLRTASTSATKSWSNVGPRTCPESQSVATCD